MTILKLKIADANLETWVNYLVEELAFDYENHSTDSSLLAVEHLSFRNPSGQLNLVVFKREGSFILVDVVAGGGTRGLLDIVGNSEKGFTDLVGKKIHAYAGNTASRWKCWGKPDAVDLTLTQATLFNFAIRPEKNLSGLHQTFGYTTYWS
jgi:hypothetical protein